jgi:hypothetical protein
MSRTVWVLTMVVGFAGTSWADPPPGRGVGTIFLGTPIHAGGPASFGGYGGGGLSIGFSNGRGFGIGIHIPANPAPRYYPAPLYPPVQYTRSSVIYRSPAYAPGGVFDLPPLTISNPLAAPRPTNPGAIPPAAPINRPPDTFRYDGGPATPVPLPAPDARPPAQVKPPSDGVMVSLPGRPVAKPGYGYPAHTPK